MLDLLDADLGGVDEELRRRLVLFRLLIGLGGQLRVLMDRRLQEEGLTTQQAALLTVARNSDPPASQGTIARYLGVSHQNARQIARPLERKGLLRVETDAEDRRIRRMLPTMECDRLFEHRNPRDHAAVSEWFDVFEADEAEWLESLLRRLAERLLSTEQDAGRDRAVSKSIHADVTADVGDRG